MRRLLDFLYRRRTIAIFIGLEIICAWLIVSYNQRQNADFLNSSNAMAARISSTSESIADYFSLAEENERLMMENELLESKLLALQQGEDSSSFLNGSFSLVRSKVINNTFRRAANFLTIDAGQNNGVKPGMGVISGFGIVGQVKSVSSNFATIYSVLHPNVMVSASVKRTDTNCTVQWDQRSYDEASLKYVPRHIDLRVGDTVITSGYNSTFPPGIDVGIVSDIGLEDHMTFYEARVRLSTDFTSLPYVMVVIDEFKQERDSLTYDE